MSRTRSTGSARSRRSGRVPRTSRWLPGSTDSSGSDLSRALHERSVVRATLMRETLHLVAAEDYPHDAVAMATYFRNLRPNHLPEGVDMKRVVELAGHAAEALAEPLEATALRPILVRAGSSRWRTTASGAASARTRRSCTCPATSRTPSASGTASSRPQPGSGALEAEEADGVTRLVRRYLAAFGPASRADVAAFTGLAVATLAPRARQRSSRSWSG